MTEWIVDNKVTRNIGLVQHVGDVTNRNNDVEFARMAPAFALLDGEVPYIVAQETTTSDRTELRATEARRSTTTLTRASTTTRLAFRSSTALRSQNSSSTPDA